MKTLIILLFSLSLTTLVNAQAGISIDQTGFQRLVISSEHPQILSQNSTRGAEGTPYYNKDWQQGYVMMDKHSRSSDVQLKYSSYSNELLFLQGNQTMALPSNKFEGFVLIGDGQKTIFKRGYHSDEYDIAPQQLMRVLYEGNVLLLAKESAMLHRGKDPFTKARKYSFYQNTDYFLRSTDGQFHEVKLKEDDILEALGNHQDELKQYAEKQSINFENKVGLQQILSKYDEMLESGN